MLTFVGFTAGAIGASRLRNLVEKLLIGHGMWEKSVFIEPDRNRKQLEHLPRLSFLSLDIY